MFLVLRRGGDNSKGLLTKIPVILFKAPGSVDVFVTMSVEHFE